MAGPPGEAAGDGGACVVVGAGIAGLSCASALARAGRAVTVLERSRGVGGRCATWRHDGQPIDYGAAFVHGSDPDFLASLETIEGATPIPGWPSRVEGRGTPCQPSAFRENERRLAFAEGLTTWPKSLARRLDVRLGSRVVSIARGEGLRATTLLLEGGGRIAAGDLVLAVPAGQALPLLRDIDDPSEELRAAIALLAMLASSPCLTLMASYPISTAPPPWEILYPEESRILHLVSHDSSKRPGARHRVLVLQGLPCWSRLRGAASPDDWAGEILGEAARFAGRWAASPLWWKAHRWRLGRADGGSELSGPLLIGLDRGGRIGLAGECFAAGGGIEAAWLSGRALARRMAGPPAHRPIGPIGEGERG